MKNKNILIALVGLGVLYALYMKNKNKPKVYSKECYDALATRNMQEDVKPANFEKDFLENCEKNKKLGQANTTPKNYTPRQPQIRENTIEEQIEFKTKFYKTLPDSFTLDNVNYTKNSNLEFYKQPFTPNTFSGVQPIKISSAEFSNAYNKFKNIGKDLDYFQKVK
jgi:hypothetical protein